MPPAVRNNPLRRRFALPAHRTSGWTTRDFSHIHDEKHTTMTHYDQYLAPHLEMVRGIVRRHSYPTSEADDNFQSVVLHLLEHLDDVATLALAPRPTDGAFDPRPWIATVTLHALANLNRRTQRHRALYLDPASPVGDNDSTAAEEAGTLPAAAADFAPDALPAETTPPTLWDATAHIDNAVLTDRAATKGGGPTDNDDCLERWHRAQLRPGFHRTKAGRLWTAMRQRARQATSAFGYARVLNGALARGLAALGTETRSVVLLHADGWSAPEIASAMGLAAPSVRQLLSRGRARLARIRKCSRNFRRENLAD